MIWQKEITLPAYNRGYHLITNHVLKAIELFPENGLLHIFIKHTSAGLTINENADPTVRYDFENHFNKLAPDDLSKYSHNSEGEDDMPAHLKSSILGAQLTIPITNKKLNLGTWQGVYLCEFRNYGGQRKIVLTLYY